MIERGWNLGPAGADGAYGPITAGVAGEFQRRFAIPPGVTREVGPNTWAAAWNLPVR